MTNYSGRSLNAPENSSVLINPNFERTAELKEWYSNQSNLSQLRSVSLDNKCTNGARANNQRFINELPGFLEEEFLKKGTDKNIYFVINGFVHHVRNDEKNVYNSCPENTCKRKVRFEEASRKWI